MANQSNNPKKQDKEDTKNKKPCDFLLLYPLYL